MAGMEVGAPRYVPRTVIARPPHDMPRQIRDGALGPPCIRSLFIQLILTSNHQQTTSCLSLSLSLSLRPGKNASLFRANSLACIFRHRQLTPHAIERVWKLPLSQDPGYLLTNRFQLAQPITGILLIVASYCQTPNLHKATPPLGRSAIAGHPSRLSGIVDESVMYA
ncbi:uncharacterized protein LY79DRAFT_249436 [Colletotrichum navitas]|uniref:Uncharacterized protein n=1 Tax=Colletotrichum navitas TaxID=681940 RepID=A0AAD8Q9V9_9PEZI|nr:uncharacterized protein LY79DRAFT_249436 [Colletotrichum navitas]KAK1598597.1 hypothetical protein LY79DRAFT_249436 [Colletotrichum navitas]